MLIGLYIRRESVDSYILAEVVSVADHSAAWKALERFSLDNPSRVVRSRIVGNPAPKESTVALLNQDSRGKLAGKLESRAGLKQRLELSEIFADIRGAMPASFNVATYY